MRQSHNSSLVYPWFRRRPNTSRGNISSSLWRAAACVSVCYNRFITSRNRTAMSCRVLVFVLVAVGTSESFSDARRSTGGSRGESSWRLDPNAFWPAVEKFAAMHSHLAAHDDDVESFLRAREGRNPDEGEAEGDEDEGERLFHLLYTPSPTPPGFSSFLDLLQFAKELRGAVNRLSEQDEDTEENASLREPLFPETKKKVKRPLELALEDVEESKENGKISEENEEHKLVENGASTKNPSRQDANWIEAPAGDEGAGDLSTRPRRCAGVHPQPEEDDPAEPRTTDNKKRHKKHKPYFADFSFSVPVFQFDFPFSNFKILPLTDPYALPEDE
ncbi:uncharacterized protein LOC119579119 [Penaeus monodon]|uniref:uncharacterized protein LOC119579119 n=1 Tax=Penaeus monodon TaxID=6687 RepID=UPI0018A7475A|nr:uncharacterized protein LOC119579119 [Penaeus monodon]